MEESVKYDYLQLQKMNLQELYNIALWRGLDIENQPKQKIIYEILNAQK